MAQLNSETDNICDTEHICFIIPPHILRGIEESEEAHPDAREFARSALAHTRELRAARVLYLERLIADAEGAFSTSHAIPLDPQAVLEAAPPAGVHANRMLYTSGQTQNLPGTLERAEGKPPASDAAANQCYDGFGSTFELYAKVFSRNSIDGKGMTMVGSVHYDKKFNNAFWNGRQMVFGDGDGITFKSGGFTQIIDVIGHELTHGVTQYTARLEYKGQSGALNESISDVFGSMVKQYHLKQKACDADWLIGAGIWGPGIHGVALRSMKAPGTAYNDPKLGGKDRQPGTMKDFVTTQQDNGGVHINSGIPNHAFYLVAVAFGGYSWEKAGKIWYLTMLDKRMTPQISFKLFADVTCDIAMKEFGQTGKDIVMKAWKAVGVY